MPELNKIALSALAVGFVAATPYPPRIDLDDATTTKAAITTPVSIAIVANGPTAEISTIQEPVTARAAGGMPIFYSIIGPAGDFDATTTETSVTATSTGHGWDIFNAGPLVEREDGGEPLPIFVAGKLTKSPGVTEFANPDAMKTAIANGPLVTLLPEDNPFAGLNDMEADETEKLAVRAEEIWPVDECLDSRCYQRGHAGPLHIFPKTMNTPVAAEEPEHLAARAGIWDGLPYECDIVCLPKWAPITFATSTTAAAVAEKMAEATSTAPVTTTELATPSATIAARTSREKHFGNAFYYTDGNMMGTPVLVPWASSLFLKHPSTTQESAEKRTAAAEVITTCFPAPKESAKPDCFGRHCGPMNFSPSAVETKCVETTVGSQAAMESIRRGKLLD